MPDPTADRPDPLRDADLAEADLTEAFFLTQSQLNTARGSAGTLLPASVTRPAHWTART